MTTPKLFICYRREDSAYPAHQIKDKVAAHFGPGAVVFDVDTIPIGTNFRVYLDNEVSKCDILLAVIGDQWLEFLKQRLGDPTDFVRIEIQTALKREIPIVPILVGHASPPSEKDLPPELAELSHRQAAEVRAGRDLQTHLERLIHGLVHVLTEKEEEKQREEAAKSGAQQQERRRPEEEAREAKEGSRQRVAAEGARMEKEDPLNKRIFLEGGRFLMGSPEGEGSDDERPQHWVQVSPFYIQEHPVTNAEYVRFKTDHGFATGREDHPIVNVSWHDALAYAQIIGGSLPTEAQWEFAARGAEGRKYPWGNEEPTPELANFGDNVGDTTPVKSYSKGATPEGVHDLAGNVWEWCRDWYGPYPEGEQTDPLSSENESFRVLRGGSFGYNPSYVRGAPRHALTPVYQDSIAGFRVAWSGWRDKRSDLA